MAKFFKPEEEAIIKNHIHQAEERSSGEIRVYVEPKCKIELHQRAMDIFIKHKIYRTRQKNGVLIYIAYESHGIYILGDEGIHLKAGQRLWDHALMTMQSLFAKQQYLDGLTAAIDIVGNELRKFFPPTQQENEIPDDVIYGADED